MVIGSMEDEQCFPIISFMKSKLKNKLTNHFDLVVNMFAQDYYFIDIFPFGDVIKVVKIRSKGIFFAILTL